MKSPQSNVVRKCEMCLQCKCVRLGADCDEFFDRSSGALEHHQY